jgi:hypothetical protein
MSSFELKNARQFVPPWNFPHEQKKWSLNCDDEVPTPREEQALKPLVFVGHTDDDDDGGAVTSANDSEHNTFLRDDEKAPSDAGDSAATGSSTATPRSNAQIDPFSSVMWLNRERVERNNHTLNRYMDEGGTSYNSSSLYNATWCGFGPILRPRVWSTRLSLIIAERLKLRKLVESRGMEYVDYVDIMKDMTRTYSPLEELPPPHLSARRQLESIYHLLTAYASYNRSVGYAQSLNRLALVLVEVFTEPWEQFWTLDYIVTRVMPHYYVRNNCLGLLVDIQLMSYYVHRRDKQLSEALRKLDDPESGMNQYLLSTLCARWFPPMFVGVMRFGNVLRLWDWIIINGAPELFTFMFRVLVHNRDMIMAATDATAIITALDKWLESLESLDVITGNKDIQPIEAGDVDARRASQLKALLTAQRGERIYNVHVATKTTSYINLGRGCLCERNVGQSRVKTPPPPPVDSFGPFISAAPAAIRYRAASVPKWTHRSVGERLLDGQLDTFSSDSIPLAAPLRVASTSATRHSRSGTSVVSSNTTIGSDAEGSNGVDG